MELFGIVLSPTILWLLLTIVLLIVEAVTVNLVTLWFAVGAFAAMFVSMSSVDPIWQWVVFLAVSILLLIFTRPIALRYIKKAPTNADSAIGKIGIVTEKIDNIAATGRVKLDGNSWAARSQDESIIEEGAEVQVKEIQGVRLIVVKK